MTDKKVTKKVDTNEVKKNSVIRRMLVGIVVKKSADKTIRVRVARMVIHPKYKKRYYVHRMYLVHDPKNVYVEGQKVIIVACRPISKNKSFMVVYSSTNE